MRFDVWTSTACAALFAACALFLAAPSRAAEFSNDQKAEIGKIVKEYLLANPDVVKDAIEELDKREKVAEASARETTLAKQADKLFNSPNQAVVGNPDGDVTLVEFFDYNCGYCKQSLTNVAKLIDRATRSCAWCSRISPFWGLIRSRRRKSRRRCITSSRARNSGNFTASC